MIAKLDPIEEVLNATVQSAAAQAGVEQAETLTPQVRRALQSAWRRMASNHDNLEVVTSVLNTLHYELLELFERAVRIGAEAALRLDASFSLPAPAARAWAATRAGTLVTNLGDEAKATIRELTTSGLIEGVGPSVLAQRIHRHVGLLPRDQRAVGNLEAGMAKAGSRPSQIRRASNEYAERLREARSLNIARTELLTARNYGSWATWQRAAGEGRLPSGAMRRYLTAVDEMVCPECGPLHGQMVPIGAAFQGPRGAFLYPPLHPGCRCTHSVVHPAINPELFR